MEVTPLDAVFRAGGGSLPCPGPGVPRPVTLGRTRGAAPDATLARRCSARAPHVTHPLPFRLGDRLELRRPHPCGGRAWDVDRLGADLGLRCVTCGRHVRWSAAPSSGAWSVSSARGPEVAA